MATKKAGKSTTGHHDPLNKWDGDPADTAKESVDNAASFSAQIESMTRRMSEPGLSNGARRALYGGLAEAKKGLKEAQANTAKILAVFKNKGSLKDEAKMKLKDVKTLLKAQGTDPAVAAYAKVTESLLKELIKGVDKLDDNDDDDKKEKASLALLELLKGVKDSTKVLPKELKDQLKEVSDLFAAATKEQAASQRKEQEKWGKDFTRASGVLAEHAKGKKEWRNRLGMGIADKIGIGGAIRGVGKVNDWRKKRNELKAARKIVGITKTKMASVGADTKAEEATERDGELVDILKDYVKENKAFNRKLLGGLGKGKAVGGSSDSIADSITGGLAKFFTGAALAELLATLAAKLGLTKLIPPVVPPISKVPKVPGEAATGAGSRLASIAKLAMKGGIGLGLLTHSGELGSNEVEELAKRRNMAPTTNKTDLPLPDPARMSGGDAVTGAVMGGGRGSVNPDMVTPTDTASVSSVASNNSAASAPTVSTGSQVSGAATGSSIQTNGDVDIKGLNPGVRHNLDLMADEYFDLTGKKLPLNSAYRSIEKQAQLYKTMPAGMAAAPGKSIHNYGMAVDTNSAAGNKLVSSGLLAKYGFDRPISKEPWHIQPAGLTLAAAKAGLYSADAPNDQGSTARATPVSQSITAAVSPSATGETGSSPTTLGGNSGSKGSISAPSQNSVKDIPTFDQSDGMFLAMNLGIC